MLGFRDGFWICEGAPVDVEANFLDVVVFDAQVFDDVLGGDNFGRFGRAR